MSQWIERITTNQIWGELKSLGLAIDRACARENQDAIAIDGLERIRTVLTFCGKRLATTDPILINPTSLASLNNKLVTAKSEIEAYATDGVISHITTANTSADELLIALPQILGTISTDDLTVISESVSSYRTTLEKHLQAALATQQQLKEASATNETKIAVNEEKIIALEKELNAEQQKLKALALEHQTLFSTAQDKRASEFSTVLADQQTKYAANAAEQQTQFSRDQDSRNSDYAAVQIANQEKFSTLMADYTQKLKEQEKALAEELAVAAKNYEAKLSVLQHEYGVAANEILDQIKTHKKEVEDLVGVIGNLGVTHGYQKVANLARKMLFVWQFVTVLALGGLIYVAYLMAFPPITKNVSVVMEVSRAISASTPPSTTQPSEKNVPSASPQVAPQATQMQVPDAVFYQGLATRIFLSLACGIFAAYAAKQASHFLDMERRNRKLALELEALNSYIAPLDKDKRDEFRLKIGDRSFGMPDGDLNKQKTEGSDVMSMKDFGEFIINLMKESKPK